MLSLSKILAPVAFSDECRGTVRQAVALACRFRSELTLLHVAEPLHYAFSGWESSFNVPEILDSRAAELRKKLDSVFASELEKFPATKLLADGDPASEIVARAHGERMDLIMMPTHGYGAFRRFLLGSVTAKILHDARCPVWTGVHMAEALMPEHLSYRKIACAVDLGPQTRAALGWAAGLAAAWAADLTIIHAIPSYDRGPADLPEKEWRQRLSEIARQEIATHQEALGIQAEVYVESGALPDSVCLPAGRIAADVLVIGRGHGSSGGGRLPSHAYSIIRVSPCPVVSV
jgi:nucleotide-binding universal stress UspA family protein